MDVPLLFGIAGLLLISFGVIIKDRKHEDILYIAGGLCLEIYSISIESIVFMVLQVVFIMAAIGDLIRISKE